MNCTKVICADCLVLSGVRCWSTIWPWHLHIKKENFNKSLDEFIDTAWKFEKYKRLQKTTSTTPSDPSLLSLYFSGHLICFVLFMFTSAQLDLALVKGEISALHVTQLCCLFSFWQLDLIRKEAGCFVSCFSANSFWLPWLSCSPLLEEIYVLRKGPPTFSKESSIFSQQSLYSGC